MKNVLIFSCYSQYKEKNSQSRKRKGGIFKEMKIEGHGKRKSEVMHGNTS